VIRLLQLFIDICLLRAKPQDLPVSSFLFGLTIVVALVTAIPGLVLTMKSISTALAAAAMNTVLVLIFLRGGLYFMKMEPRFLQTATALFGSGAMLDLLAIPVYLMLVPEPGTNVASLLGSLFFLLLLVWSLIVAGHILRHSLEIKLGGGVAIAVLYYVLIGLLVQQLPGAA
jgi:hypothetical protein